ncbi:FAD-binding monooxygenase [Frondihabitans sp. PAMC 28766]|uniref:FAD-dependent monooxygenase n=1 Tax=Frondihabitans sp. PAMC 28766 TaxID=1795630 RepID=UPI00078C93F0|nr:FAD-dependent monooxygenase [Frondihabitans sp. PAMC 28766]AMM19980.1 FAD-binding monooxygenase [Frondihabitans sp. PAMC 28766]
MQQPLAHTRPRILIAGASIAGPALAFWLNRYGYDTTIVERAAAFREGGQNIDIRGAGREVLRRSGLEDAVREATTGEVGTRFVGSDGRPVAEFAASKSDTVGPTAEVEILRGDLSRILVDATRPDSEGGTAYVYGDRITGLDDSGEQVTVAFEQGPSQSFDLVVAADGIGSATRGLVFGDEVSITSLGMETTYFTIPRTDADDDWWNWFNATPGLSVTLRPDRHGTIRAVLSTVIYDPGEARGAGVDRRSLADQKARLHDEFAGVGWEAPRVLAALDATQDAYTESIGQVHAPAWSRGRTALLGDAAWCASPVSGMGTSLSMVGAYVLAGELAAHVDHRDAFAGYERIMRPYVDQAQKLPPGVPRIANPRTRAGLAAFHAGLRVASSRLVGGLGSKLFSPPADEIELPDYAHLERTRV